MRVSESGCEVLPEAEQEWFSLQSLVCAHMKCSIGEPYRIVCSFATVCETQTCQPAHLSAGWHVWLFGGEDFLGCFDHDSDGEKGDDDEDERDGVEVTGGNGEKNDEDNEHDFRGALICDKTNASEDSFHDVPPCCVANLMF